MDTNNFPATTPMTEEQTAWFQAHMNPIYDVTDELLHSLGTEDAAQLDSIVGQLKELIQKVAVELY